MFCVYERLLARPADLDQNTRVAGLQPQQERLEKVACVVIWPFLQLTFRGELSQDP
jgi:hypothetical protein